MKWWLFKVLQSLLIQLKSGIQSLNSDNFVKNKAYEVHIRALFFP
jgi:hypothetical protein